jgi:hypothetical protein
LLAKAILTIHASPREGSRPLAGAGQKSPSIPELELKINVVTNDLAADFYSAIVIAIAGVLQQMRHFRKRAPFAITRQMWLSLPTGRLGIQFHGMILRDTKQGYKGRIGPG